MPSLLQDTIHTAPFFFLFHGNHQPGFDSFYFSGEVVPEPIPGETYGIIVRYPAHETDAANRLKLFRPELCTYIKANTLHCFTSLPETDASQTAAPIVLKPALSKAAYIEKVEALKKHIHLGDIYEVNFCMEFSSEQVELNPLKLYKTLNSISEAPFSALVKLGSTYMICSSPERFLKKEGAHLFSQPIKGTAKRGRNETEDKALKEHLRNSLKEQTENVMIVDVVRNDLSKLATKGSVEVDELFGIHSYKQVHQMVSTVSCTLKAGTSFTDIMRATFPMASMTGAPKQRACDLIRQYEVSDRDLYSGALGFMNANGDFDLNVVIRTIIYNSETKRVSFHVGSAITAMCHAAEEYDECMVKAAAMVKALGASFMQV